MSDQIKILIVEDEVIIAMHLEDELKAAGYKIIGVAADSETALDMIHSRQPDFIMLDININGLRDGIDVAQIIVEKYDVPFMFLTAFSDLSTLNRAKAVSPSAFLVKPFKGKDVITNVTIGLHNFRNKKDNKVLRIEDVNAKAIDHVTKKEFQILQDIIQGFTNAQISAKQHISLSTVKFHCQNLYSKLGVKNRTSAISFVLEM